VNVRDAEWCSSEGRGAECNFESEYRDPPVEFAQLGINVTVLEPGQSGGFYHSESAQEAFLVLSGECSLLVEGEERAPSAVGFLPLSPLDRAHLRGRRRRDVRDSDDRSSRSGYAVGGVGGALSGVAARGALRRARGGGDRRLEAGVRDGRAVPARATAIRARLPWA
jgi:hypothetical protein